MAMTLGPVKRPLGISPYVHSVYVGQPKTIADDTGTWRSSIYRDRVNGPVALELRGLAGDQAAQPYHHSTETAVCAHFLDHYRFWNDHYGLSLGPGNVGENWTLENLSEDEICTGDIYRVGTALVQVSAARTPCANQARRIGRADWVEVTLKEIRTGIYLRALEPGVMQSGDELRLVERLNPGATITALNRCYYHEFDPVLAQRCTTMPGLMEWWQRRFKDKLAREISEREVKVSA
ncbi:MAG: MOSC domain-containing protein [Anaerolineales bacterium]